MPTIADAVHPTSEAPTASARTSPDSLVSSALAPPLAERVHGACVVCSRSHPRGLRLCFRPATGGQGVVADFACDAQYQGYDGLIHGGVVSMLLDGAMAHALFDQGRVGHTGELTVRFRRPVRVGVGAIVSARVVRSKGRMHELAAELRQAGRLAAEATARFMEDRGGRARQT